VPLPYPRTEEIRLSPEFAEIRGGIWREVHHSSVEGRSGAASAHAISPVAAHPSIHQEEPS